jgi:hypothetical protein
MEEMRLLKVVSRLFSAFVWIVVSAGLSIAAMPVHAQAPAPATPQGSSQATSLSPIPMLAYYYIWFDPTSWDRAKQDYPLLGRYSSGDIDVIRQHIRWAKSAGLKGFIVSWKNTDALTARLKTLMQVADQEDFKLAIIYQGLDFSRKPLPASRIAADLDYFTTNLASDPAFQLFAKPMVIWSGTWQFSTADIQSVTQGRRESLLILASEKNVKGFQRLQTLVDGDAYYWSSVNPETYGDYEGKLGDMSAAVHAAGGLWIAPAAAGFDARQIGGTTAVDRADGALLKREVNAAISSSPDAVGIISWNEFSENSYIEPSEKYGKQYLAVLQQINQVASPPLAEFDSSEPGPVARPALAGNVWLAIGSLVLVALASLGVIVWRQVKGRKA